MSTIPKCKKAMKLKAKAKPGRGRAEPGDVILALTDEEGWTAYKEQLKNMDKADMDAMIEFFNDSEKTEIDNDTLGDALFGEDEPDDFKNLANSFGDEDLKKCVEMLYNTGIIDEETFNDD